MADLKVRHLVVGAVATNCYIAENKKTKEALIIDPGDNAARIVQIIKEDGVVPVAVLLTHGHFDHAMAAQEVAEQYGIKIYAHETEKETLETPQINLSGMIGRTLTFHADCYVKDGEILNLAGFEIRCCIHRDIPRVVSAIISKRKKHCFPEIHCFASPLAERIFRQESPRH